MYRSTVSATRDTLFIEELIGKSKLLHYYSAPWWWWDAKFVVHQ